MSQTLRRLAVAVVLVALAVPAYAAEPMDTVRGSVDRALKVLQNPTLTGEAHTAQRHKELSEIASRVFDFEEMSRRAVESDSARRCHRALQGGVCAQPARPFESERRGGATSIPFAGPSAPGKSDEITGWCRPSARGRWS